MVEQKRIKQNGLLGCKGCKISQEHPSSVVELGKTYFRQSPAPLPRSTKRLKSFFHLPRPKMPDDDYHTPGGGLKLKGSKPTGIKKKKKKSSSASTLSRDTALQKAAAEEACSSKQSEDDDELRELEQRDPHDGKTAAEKAAEEMRRKRVRLSSLCLLFFSCALPLLQEIHIPASAEHLS
jgi:protein FAM32A